MKKLILGFCCIILSACAYADLEERVTRLEKISMPTVLTELAGANARWRDGRTTQGSSNVDEITGMSDGDWVIVVEEDGADSDVYFYTYDAGADCSPAADGLQRIDGTGSTDCWHRLDFNFFDNIVHKTDDYTLTIADSGKVFTNAGANPADATSVDFTCPLCNESNEGWKAVIYNMDTTYDLRVVPNASNSINDFSSGEDGEYISADEVVGSAVKVMCLKGDDGTYDIYTGGYIGTWSQED